MSLAQRTVLVFSLLGLCLCGGGYAVQKFTVLPAFEAFQREATLDSVARVRDVFDAELTVLVTLNNEYSYWDDTYAFLQGRAADYREENLREDYLLELGIDFLLIADRVGVERFLYLDHDGGGQEVTLAGLLREPVTPSHPLLRPGLDAEPVSGALLTRRGLLLVTSYPIVKTSGEGPQQGSLAMGRFLNADALAAIGDRVTADIRLYDVSAETMGEAPGSARRALADRPEEVYVAKGDGYASAYFLIADVFGAPSTIVEVTDRNSLADVAAVSLRSAILITAIASLLFVLLAWILAHRFVVRPVRTLSEEIHRIRETGELKVKIAPGRSDEVGTLSSDFAALTDELAQAHRELRRARDEAIEASNTKSEFLARMSHEIRTPLNGVLGMTEVLQSTSLSERQQSIADTITRSGRSLLELINDILDFSKIEAGKMELEPVETDLQALLEETIAAFQVQAEQKGVDLRLHVEPPLRHAVWLDRVRLRQILNNLIGNALKFTPEGSVTLSVYSTATGSGTLLTEFAVTDTGIGIRPEMLAIIFESFTQADAGTTRKFGGSGLGLSICQQLVELMGGEISATSEPNKGARFVFELELPVGVEILPSPGCNARSAAPTRVLIVEDNPVEQAVAAASVQHFDFEPTIVDSGRRAIEAAGDEGFAAILMDCAIPDLDGYAAARAIREQESDSGRPPSLIVGLTEDSVARDRARCIESGMDACMKKPFNIDDLRGALAPLLDDVVT